MSFLVRVLVVAMFVFIVLTAKDIVQLLFAR